MQQLKEVVIANNDKFNTEAGKTNITIESDALADRFYNAMRKVRWIHSFDNWWSLTAINLKLSNHRSITTSTAHIIINLNNIDSLVLDFGRLSLATGVSSDGIQYMKIEVGILSDLTSVDLEFIKHCHHKELGIKNTPLKTDKNQLVNILQHSCKLEVLRIGCLANRTSAVINLVTSTREKTLQRGESVPLRTLEMMDEGLVPFDVFGIADNHNHIATTLKFTEDSKVFDMCTRIKLRCNTIAKDDPVCDYFRQYGWTIEILYAPTTFNDNLASLLYDSTQKRGSRITTLAMIPSLTKSGMDALDQIIRMSPSLVSLQLWFNCLEEAHQLENTLLLLGRYKGMLEYLGFYGDYISTWLPQITRAVTRNSFPKMKVFSVGSYSRFDFPRDCIPWIVAMVSIPPQLQALTRLDGFHLQHVTLQLGDWRSVIKAIDLAMVDWLYFKNTNFTHTELELLVNRIVTIDILQLSTIYLDKQLIDSMFNIGREKVITV
ncbi:hypothetical protein BGZ65_008799 [Modicella reniformis]|uniref:Uncharacterized protein n=1 Tax=Modicella reniformis TaxID=1440133 RepID=A0A9P6SS61_9FUNG|nr:hypothetical protein BGZ65_008799 [Modicella reniformis]